MPSSTVQRGGCMNRCSLNAATSSRSSRYEEASDRFNVESTGMKYRDLYAKIRLKNRGIFKTHKTILVQQKEKIKRPCTENCTWIPSGESTHSTEYWKQKCNKYPVWTPYTKFYRWTQPRAKRNNKIKDFCDYGLDIGSSSFSALTHSTNTGFIYVIPIQCGVIRPTADMERYQLVIHLFLLKLV